MKTDTFARSREQVHEITKAHAIDGDSIIGLINLGFGTHLERRMRLKGFYAPELNGANPSAAVAARSALQTALDSGPLTFPARGAREDRYGRLLIQLHVYTVPLDPVDVLGSLQLSEEAHAQDLVFAARNRKRGGIAL